MAWIYQKAKMKGSKGKPAAGDSVTMVLVDDSTLEDETPVTKEFTWGYDGTQAWGQFKKMVRDEVKAHLAHLNAMAAEDDVSAEFDPR